MYFWLTGYQVSKGISLHAEKEMHVLKKRVIGMYPQNVDMHTKNLFTTSSDIHFTIMSKGSYDHKDITWR